MTRYGAAVLLGLLAFVWGAEAHARRGAEPRRLLYSGQLRDEAGAAIGGIYPLTFALHKTGETRKRLWWETHWVAVDEGVYTVELGGEKPIPEKLDLTSLYIGVSLTGGGEMVRERLSERNQPEEPVAPAPPVPGVAAPGAPSVRTGGGGTVDYAEKAGLAYEAEHARDSDRIGNLTMEQLDERFKTRKSGARLGTARRYSGSAGGEGGRPFRLVCPKGYVAVGIRGAGGIYIDSLEVICAPLE